MKKIMTVIGLAAFLCVPVFTPGCSTTPVKLATQVESATILTVDGAMHGWADWVNAGKASKAEVVQVHAAYDKYYSAQLLAKSALVLWAQGTDPQGVQYTDAKAQLDLAKNALIDLINILTAKQ